MALGDLGLDDVWVQTEEVTVDGSEVAIGQFWQLKHCYFGLLVDAYYLVSLGQSELADVCVLVSRLIVDLGETGRDGFG